MAFLRDNSPDEVIWTSAAIIKMQECFFLFHFKYPSRDVQML